MTVLALIAAGLLAVIGTELAVLAFAVAAVLGVTSGGTLGPIATLTAALAGGSVLLGTAPRRVAVPALAAAAALLAGSSADGAVVLSAWTLSSAAAVSDRKRGGLGDVWALSVFAADVPVFAAVMYAVSRGGFVGWQDSLGWIGSALLVVASFARIPIVAAPAGSSESGSIGVRAQAFVLASVALGSRPPGVVVPTLCAGVAVFAAAAFARSQPLRDRLQEGGLVVGALAGAALAGGSRAGLWLALTGGTLIHHLRSRDNRAERAYQAMRTLTDLAVPLLPAVAAIGAVALAESGAVGQIAMTGLIGGVGLGIATPSSSDGGRAKIRRPDKDPPSGISRVEGARSGSVAALALAAGFFAPLVATHSVPPIPWPPLWCCLSVSGLAALGYAFPAWVPSVPRVQKQTEAPKIRQLVGFGVHPRSVPIAMACFVLASGVMWVLGWSRGFL